VASIAVFGVEADAVLDVRAGLVLGMAEHERILGIGRAARERHAKPPKKDGRCPD
jgi:hypothetical protein